MDCVLFVLQNFRENVSQLLPIVAPLTALLAVVVGPLISLHISKRTLVAQEKTVERQMSTQIRIAENGIKAQVLSANRQKWINDVRDTVCELQSTVNGITALLRAADENKTEVGEGFNDKIEQAHHLLFRLRLLMNPIEAEHDLFLASVDKLMIEFHKGTKSSSSLIGKLQNELTQNAQVILKKEWERVKSGD